MSVGGLVNCNAASFAQDSISSVFPSSQEIEHQHYSLPNVPASSLQKNYSYDKKHSNYQSDTRTPL